MRTLGIPFLGLFLVSFAILACEGLEAPADPGPTSPGDGAARASGLGNGSDMVPYRARASFVPESAAVTVCAPAAAGVALPAVLLATGQHTHLGRTTSRITVESCELTATGVLGGGHFSHTSPRGDGFGGIWDALFTPPTFTFVENLKDHPIVAESGTGRFEGITGHFRGSGTLDPATGVGTFSVLGEVRSVGSLK